MAGREDGKGLGQLGDGALPLDEHLDDRETGRIAEGLEDLGLILNHLVKLITSLATEVAQSEDFSSAVQFLATLSLKLNIQKC